MQHLISYCPQFDCVEDFTVRETLRAFALLRGLPKYTIDAVVSHITKQLQFYNHIDQLCNTLRFERSTFTMPFERLIEAVDHAVPVINGN